MNTSSEHTCVNAAGQLVFCRCCQEWIFHVLFRSVHPKGNQVEQKSTTGKPQDYPAIDPFSIIVRDPCVIDPLTYEADGEAQEQEMGNARHGELKFPLVHGAEVDRGNVRRGVSARVS